MTRALAAGLGATRTEALHFLLLGEAANTCTISAVTASASARFVCVFNISSFSANRGLFLVVVFACINIACLPVCALSLERGFPSAQASSAKTVSNFMTQS